MSLNSMNVFTENGKVNKKLSVADNSMLDYIVSTIIAQFSQDYLAFKGGYMLNQLIPEYSRMTRDVDFSVASAEHYEDIKKILKQIGDYFVKEELIASYNIKPDIKPTMSGGADFYNSDGQKILGVDVGWHQVVSGSRWYNLSIGNIHAFTVERMLSDKTHVIFSPKRFRRVKDLYDVFYLLEYFDVDFEQFKYQLNLRGELDLNKTPFREEVLVQYLHAWDKLKVVSHIDGSALSKPDFKLVMHRISKFYHNLYLEDSKCYSLWSKDECEWR